MMSNKLKVLFVEDSESDAELLARRLQRAGLELVFDRVETAAEMTAALAGQEFDLLIVDYNLPQFSAPAALDLYHQLNLDMPFIVVSGAMGEDKAVDMMRGGAHDYLLKDNLARLAPAVQRELREYEARQRHRQAQQALIDSEITLATILKSTPAGIGLIKDRVFQWVNDRLIDMTGYSREELLGQSARMLYADEAEFHRVGNYKYALIRERGWGEIETRFQCKDGGLIDVHLSSRAINPADLSAGVVFTAIDITARKLAEQELKLKEILLDNASDSIFLHDLEGRFLYVNEAAYKDRGYTRDELLARSVTSLVTPEYALIREQRLQDLMVQGETVFVSEHLRKNGSSLPVEIHARTLEVGDRRLILSVARDITERQQAMAALQQARRQWEDTFQAIGHPTIIMDGNHQILEANQATQVITGLTQKELVGKKCFEVFHPGEGQPPHECPMEKLLASGLMETVEMEMQALGGTFLVSCTPMFDPQGGLARIIHIATDITARKQAEAARRLDEARLEALVQLGQMHEASLGELAHFALEEGVRLTGSQMGYVSFMNDDETELIIYAWSREVMAQCATEEQVMVIPLAGAGQWAEAVRQRQPVIINDGAAPHPAKKGYPPGHATIKRHLTAPVLDHGRIVAVAGVANKIEPYDDADVRQLTLLMDGMWRLVERQRTQEALINAAHKWRTTFDAIGDAVSLLDLDSRVLQCNQAMADLVGKPYGDIIGRMCWEVVHQTRGPIDGCPINRMMTSR
jgi:PAS domain S-box-containing protein